VATLTNFTLPTLKPVAVPTTNALSAGPDQFAAQFAAKYLLRFNNPTGVAFTIKLDDPTSVAPPNAETFDPDVTVVVTNAQVRQVTVDAARFRSNPAGMISWTYSAGTGVGSTVEITGPLP